jgi:hypothetical protein
MKKTIKSFVVKVILRGHGVVQFDGKDQKYAHNKSKNVPVKAKYDNVSFAKAHFVDIGADKDGNRIIMKFLELSANGIRHATHFKEHPFHTPNIGVHDAYRIPYLANIGTQQRGYLITGTNERRKSCYAVTAAKEISGATPVLEFYSRSGAKDSNENKVSDEDANDTTIHSRDSVGDTVYACTLLIDPIELGFISLSELQDRRALLPESEKIFRAAFGANLGSDVRASSYYVKKDSAYQIPEHGILLTEDQVKFMVADLFRKVASIDIRKSQNGYAKTYEVKVKAVFDPLVDLETSETGWHTIFDSNGYHQPEVDSVLSEQLDSVYQEKSTAEAVAEVEAFNSAIAVAKKEATAKKKAKKDTEAMAKKGKTSTAKDSEEEG